MLYHDVIRPSTSPWASPEVLIKKKDISFDECLTQLTKILALFTKTGLHLQKRNFVHLLVWLIIIENLFHIFLILHDLFTH